MTERRGDGAFRPRLDVQQREGKPLTFFRERTRCRWKAFALCERTLERLQTLLRDARLLAQRLALGSDTGVEHSPRPCELGPQVLDQRLRTLATQFQPLPRATQPVERCGRLLAASRRIGELFLCAAALRQQRLELLVGMLACEHGRGAATVAVLEPFAQLPEVELRDTCAQ